MKNQSIKSQGIKRSRSRQRGQSMIEYFIVAAFTVIVLIEGGQNSEVQAVIKAIKNSYLGYTYASSFATNLNIK